MKKSVILAIVLMTSGVADAGLTLSIVGPVDGKVTPGQVVTVQIIADAAQPATMSMCIAINGNVTASMANMTNAVRPGEVYDVTGESGDKYAFLADLAILVPTPQMMPPGVVVDGIELTAGTAGSFRVVALNPDGEIVYGDLTVQIIPEPMTLALFTVGGLFLRRRIL